MPSCWLGCLSFTLVRFSAIPTYTRIYATGTAGQNCEAHILYSSGQLERSAVSIECPVPPNHSSPQCQPGGVPKIGTCQHSRSGSIQTFSLLRISYYPLFKNTYSSVIINYNSDLVSIREIIKTRKIIQVVPKAFCVSMQCPHSGRMFVLQLI